MSIKASPTNTRSRADRGAAEPARFALLGLLLLQPSHGYDLARRFRRTSALGNVIHLGASHLYALLVRLERDGLIAGQQEDAGGRPQRRVYELTQTGQEAVEGWLAEPVSHPRDMLLDFPLKLYVAWSLGGTWATTLVQRQQATFRAYIAHLEAEQVGGDSAGDAAFKVAIRAGRIGRAEAALSWLDIHAEPLLASPGPREDTSEI